MVESFVAYEAAEDVSFGFEEREVVAAAAFVGAGDDVVVGDGGGVAAALRVGRVAGPEAGLEAGWEGFGVG